ncbi:MAG: xanthine dehydrogenase family protein molybdopterin-binding subunit [Betaproteobacteria bacterium]|jgi:isoquinoline 1-oxidoreductase beta subunit|nr:xanthine dehydrogenase family protein molybdopterin-binding subunit [Betaproteobacteria bacterium]
MKNQNQGALTRRQFVVSSALASGGLALGFHFPAAAQSNELSTLGGDEINAWVVVRPDDSCVIRIARAEMGQGTHTGLAQLVAEELECDWAKVSLQTFTPGQNLARKRVWRNMSTGGSRGIRESHEYVRQGGAAARIMLLQAAAAEWKVSVNDLSVEKGVVTHAASGKTTSYGKLASQASKLPAPDPKSIILKHPRDWKILGKSPRRLDTAPKVNGSLKYGIDTVLPGMQYAAIKACPVFGGKLVSFDASKISSRRGVKAVVRVDDHSVAVLADSFWRAKSAIEALPITWDFGANAKESSATIAERLREGLTSTNNVFADIDQGNVTEAIQGAAKKVEAVYGTQFVSHACMEPMNCTARVTSDRAEVWMPSQNAEASLAALSAVTGLPLEKCEAYNPPLGGGFGRRGGTQDYVRQAALIAKQFPGTPIKLIWTREEDMTQDYFRPIGQCRLVAGIDAKGEMVGLHLRVSGQSINAYVSPHNIVDGKDRRQLQGYWKDPGESQLGYTVANLKVEYAMRNTHVPVGPWRGVNTNQNAIYLECFIDEVAKAAGKDPLAFRRNLIKNHPKHLGVLDAVADKGGWDKPLAPGMFRGIAQFMGYGSYTAAIAEVSIKGNDVKVHRLILATNCGHAVNPVQIASQIEGSVAYGMDSLQSESSVKDGRIVEKNFDTYPIARMYQMPKIESVIAPTYDFWGGVGEPTICVVAPAILNAIANARGGKPVRMLPLKNEGLRLV